MKKSSLLIPGLVVMLSIASCKKENLPNASPSAPPAHVDAVVGTVSLNGGNISGRWTVTLDRQLDYRNDTLISNDTTMYSAGQIVLDFYSSTRYRVYGSMVPSDSGTYTVSGNHLIMDSSENYSYGVNLQTNRMRTNQASAFTSGADNYFMTEDVILDRY